ncbi:MAG: Sec-independent protein translocase subunit TatA/TatB, partial [Acidimicrobiales bacterium]
MGDLSPIKILILVVVALVVLGPEKLPEMTQKAGKAWADFRRFRESMEGQVRDAVGEAGLGDISQLTRFTNVGIKSTVASGVRSVLSSSTGVATSGIDGVES